MLRLGPQKLGISEYYDFGLSDLPKAQAEAFLGYRAQSLYDP